jgi:hypothetical protein
MGLGEDSCQKKKIPEEIAHLALGLCPLLCRQPETFALGKLP